MKERSLWVVLAVCISVLIISVIVRTEIFVIDSLLTPVESELFELSMR